MDEFLDPLDSQQEDPSGELERLAREALEAQAETNDPIATRQRCQRVIDLYAGGWVQNERDNFHAAWVMICGESQGHFSLAQLFARRSAELGEDRAWTLWAMAWDRWLVAGGKPQRFGTQIIKQHGRWSLGVVDPDISDLERALFAVPPLYVQLQRAEQLQRQENN
ncbi:hypothetical protein EYB53_003455 [Candidatus Chloroploca sp. M-50]|uniref:Uncharacterized protein n=1 Tax=Candidatus Chloroploca mongolica TaxID=2528176 RepID=A0ABS4D5P9_9CHLR|nr:hypothetical protein [Candidatus Chloroploca mongolica]MBP1464761.1 hypothetical protein [Candidatus Chloroploca mongolica]